MSVGDARPFNGGLDYLFVAEKVEQDCDTRPKPGVAPPQNGIRIRPGMQLTFEQWSLLPRKHNVIAPALSEMRWKVPARDRLGRKDILVLAGLLAAAHPPLLIDDLGGEAKGNFDVELSTIVDSMTLFVSRKQHPIPSKCTAPDVQAWLRGRSVEETKGVTSNVLAEVRDYLEIKTKSGTTHEAVKWSTTYFNSDPVLRADTGAIYTPTASDDEARRACGPATGRPAGPPAVSSTWCSLPSPTDPQGFVEVEVAIEIAGQGRRYVPVDASLADVESEFGLQSVALRRSSSYLTTDPPLLGPARRLDCSKPASAKGSEGAIGCAGIISDDSYFTIRFDSGFEPYGANAVLVVGPSDEAKFKAELIIAAGDIVVPDLARIGRSKLVDRRGSP